ncbi:transporter substrate-binding domain-containing protein [Saccharopolyspora sp. CA-218241]|uniref:transporter substrate-binding domain-containing protein n=1 Tax=Saccharopolyspora sp. CA-218241 TaxID=3240027 RepID=UPI003D969AA6
MRTAAVASAVLLAATATACSASEDEWLDVGIKSSQYGLAYYGPDPTAPFGFEITLADSLAEELNMETRWEPVVSHARESYLTTDEPDGTARVDVMIASMSMSPERNDDERYDMVGPYLETQAALMAKAGYTGPTELDNISVQRICTLDNSTTDEYLTDFNDGAGPLVRSSVTECVESLKAGDVDLVATDEIILQGVALRNPALTIVNPEIGPAEKYGIGIPKNSPVSCAAVKDWLKEYVQRDWWDHLKHAFRGELDRENYQVSPQDIESETTDC